MAREGRGSLSRACALGTERIGLKPSEGGDYRLGLVRTGRTTDAGNYSTDRLRQ